MLVTVLCVWLGWQARIVHVRRAMRNEIACSGADILNHFMGGNFKQVRTGDLDLAPSIIRRMLGDSAVRCICFEDRTTPEDIRRIDYFPEACILEPADDYDDPRMSEENTSEVPNPTAW